MGDGGGGKRREKKRREREEGGEGRERGVQEEVERGWAIGKGKQRRRAGRRRKNFASEYVPNEAIP